ncbi:hypothetical protein [Peribacillus frigoritolerans]|uniref:hypothetical protein n=1 Tax=Peribacillus frigoritolerans TaxID=450367 RepID=UPI00105A5675|nr:hypothetical protein [Peribacillus frigoritolerans]TDL77895.1 hypothetical protein E2R53_18555 [Peribacillus frigoritolerans]
MSVLVENFQGANDSAKIQAAIDYAKNNADKLVELGNREYIITGPIVIKEGVKLLFNYGSRFIVYGNFRVIELQKNASLSGAYIAIDDSTFNSVVIYLDGKYKYYNTWNKSKIENVNIINWSESYKGTGLSLYSNGTGHEISFVNFENINFAGLNTAVKLQAVKPASGYSWVNANRFVNFSIDDCVNAVVLTSSETIPNECSGNQFVNMQIQPSGMTNKLLTINGQYNEFNGVAWDLQLITHTRPIVEFTAASSYNTVNFMSIPVEKMLDRGRFNKKN